MMLIGTSSLISNFFKKGEEASTHVESVQYTIGGTNLHRVIVRGVGFHPSEAKDRKHGFVLRLSRLTTGVFKIG